MLSCDLLSDNTSVSLPLIASNEPLEGLKISRILASRDDSLWFGPAFSNSSFTAMFQAHDRAICSKFTGHQAPFLRCTCGFYAVRDVRDLGRLGPVTPFSVLSEVSLGGTIFEHDLGIRSQLQSIRRVFVANSCSMCCKNTVTHLRIARSYIPPAPLLPVCSSCAKRPSLTLTRRSKSIGDVSLELGVPVSVSTQGPLASAPSYRPLRMFARRYAPLAPLALLPISPLYTLAVVGVMAVFYLVKHHRAWL